MKIQTKYICECCNTAFETEAEALHCEDTHTTPVVFDKKEWVYGKKHPDVLTIKMCDGSVCKYVFNAELRGPGRCASI